MESFEGEVLRPDDAGFAQACSDAVWNGFKPTRCPAVVVQAASQADVARAVRLARDEGLTIGVRSGGHSWGGNGVREDGLLLDLARLDAIEIDIDANIAVSSRASVATS